MKLMAKYSRDKKLNVRNTPQGDVIRTMSTGEQVEVISVRDGWCELTDGTFINASLVDLETVDEVIEHTAGEEPVGSDGEHAEEPAEDTGELEKLTVRELKKLAKDSDIDIPAGAKKDEIIKAILADE